MKWIALTLWISLCAATITTGAVWEVRTKPQPKLPEPAAGEPSYARPGIHQMLQHARTGHGQNTLHYTVRAPNTEKRRLKKHLLRISPDLGWYTRKNGAYDQNLILATMPESSLEQAEALAADPVNWTLKALQYPPATAFQTGKLVNIRIYITGYRDRSWTPALMFITGSAALGITIIILTVVWIERRDEARERDRLAARA